MKSSARQVT